MQLEIPKINFKYWLDQWEINLSNKAYHINAMDGFSRIKENISEKECEDQIRDLVSNILDPRNEKFQVLKVIDLIYRWGGPSGRMFYIGKEKARLMLESKSDLFNRYCGAIELAQKGKASSKFLFQSLPGIGPSFASKHSAFWSANSKTPLIVVDSKIAGCLGYKTLDSLEKDFSYEQILIFFRDTVKTIDTLKNSQDLEKALFTFHRVYFKNDNNGWDEKAPKEGVDYNTAIDLSTRLKF